MLTPKVNLGSIDVWTSTLDALGRISGVGAKKLEAYGREILRVLTLAPAAD